MWTSSNHNQKKPLWSSLILVLTVLAVLCGRNVFLGQLPTEQAKAVAAAGTVSTEPLPPYFDYRRAVYTDKNSALKTSIVPAIWSQGHYGTCWTFASLASYESNWNRQLQAQGSTSRCQDFSERYLAWLAVSPPTNGTWSDPKYYLAPKSIAVQNAAWEKEVYGHGAAASQAFIEMMRWGNALETEYPYNKAKGQNMAGITAIVPSKGSVHDLFCVQTRSKNQKISPEYLKHIIRDTGVTVISLRHPSVKENTLNKTKSEYHYDGTAKLTPGTHAAAIVGWNDNYVFKDFHKNGGAKLTGAWIVRNSWDYKSGDQGYFYIPYEDTEYFTVSGSFNPERNAQRYTILDTNSDIQAVINLPVANKVSYANKLTAGVDEKLKAVTFFASRDGSAYDIQVLTGTKTPVGGKVVYSQKGTFGKDGTLPYSGFRTVDFTKEIFLAQGSEYIIKITLTAPEGQKQEIKFVGCKPGTNWSHAKSAPGLSFVYSDKLGKWTDTYAMNTNDYTQLTVPIYARAAAAE